MLCVLQKSIRSLDTFRSQTAKQIILHFTALFPRISLASKLALKGKKKPLTQDSYRQKNV